MKTSDSIALLAAALVAAHGEMTNVKRNAVASFLTSKGGTFDNAYADLEVVLKTVRPILTKNDLAIIQAPAFKEGVLYVTSRMIHKSGEWMEEESAVGSLPPDPQKAGAAITYLRRYAVMALCGIAPEDDETNLAFSNKKLKSGKTQAAASTTTTAAKPGAQPPPNKTERDVMTILRGLPAEIQAKFKKLNMTSPWDCHKLYKSVTGDLDALNQLLDEKLRQGHR
jgi:hypothetical protein